MIKTAWEISRLKDNWLGDPCWDIENTEGFEEYAEELKAFRLSCENVWKDKRNEELQTKADLLGFPGNVIFAKYIERLEDKIRSLIVWKKRSYVKTNNK